MGVALLAFQIQLLAHNGFTVTYLVAASCTTLNGNQNACHCQRLDGSTPFPLQADCRWGRLMPYIKGRLDQVGIGKLFVCASLVIDIDPKSKPLASMIFSFRDRRALHYS